MNMEDLFPEFTPISHSQEELLQRKKKKKKSLKDPFPEVTSAYNHHTDFLVDIQGIAHAPIQETYSLPSSNVHLPNCSFNTADYYDDDDDNPQFIDFGNHSDLGFSENNLHCSLNTTYDDLAEMDCDEVEDLGESSVKNTKSLEMNAEDANVASDVDVVNNDNDGCEEIPRRTEQEKKFLVFDVLRVLAENAKKVEDENENRTLLETAKSVGITFPRPSWRPKQWKSEIFNFDD
ncbi:hypothetical protein P8452_58575 [Trifolium repens]|nr:hypothetical protein P8452_58575 [Trifolium repens]